MSDWIDVQIMSAVDPGEVIGLLDDPAVQGAWQDGRTTHLYWSTSCWSSERLARLRDAIRRLAEPGSPEADIVVHSMPDQDWNQRWAQSVKPLWIGTRLVIRPSWEPVAMRPGQIEIILDPKRAFGTGHHATTRMLLEWLDEIVCGGETVLDVGTGSGLLAMVALRLGADRASGIDHDADAIDCARDYAAINGFGPELSLQGRALADEQPHDLVLANLDGQTILETAESLAAATGGVLLVSGLLRDQREEISAAFSRVNLYAGDVRERDGWIAMEFRRAQSCEGA
jgi:ribosomal protein L11 methyltransferase